MSNYAIRIQNLSKRYRLGVQETESKTLVEAVFNTISAPIKNLRRLRQLTRFSGEDEASILWALRDISFDVPQGQVVGIIGRNGAGKSTLLKVLAHITYPTGGRIETFGRISSLLEVGTGFHPELSGRDNVYLNGAVLGMRKQEIDRKFDEIVDFSGVEKFIDTPVKRYSSGMRVRLAFAVAAHLEPEILLIDEVLAVGDAEFQKKCLGQMDRVGKSGRTVFFVSHNMLAVEHLCQRVVWLNQGQVVMDGATYNVTQEYLKLADQFANTPLTQRTDRDGDGRLRFTGFSAVNAQGEKLDIIRTGQPIGLELRFDMNATSLKDIYFQIAFMNDKGQRLFNLTTRYSGGNFPEVRSNQKVRCVVPFLPLLPGIYTLNLGAKQGYDLLDSIDEAVQLEVIADNVMGSGKLQQTAGGNFIVPHSWELLETSQAVP